MNKAQLDQIEKEIRKTKHVFPKSKLNSARVKSVIAFVKTMSDEELAMFLVQFIANVSEVIHRRKLVKLLNDSQVSTVGIDVNLLLEELYLSEEKPLKLRDILKEN